MEENELNRVSFFSIFILHREHHCSYERKFHLFAFVPKQFANICFFM